MIDGTYNGFTPPPRKPSGGRLTCGVGINDSPYEVTYRDSSSGVRWVCPYYSRWSGLLSRCYNKKVQDKNPTYKGCTMVQEWLRFTNFRKWMAEQDWEGKYIDKDILREGNMEYGPETCMFVTASVNGYSTKRHNHRGDYPIGVHKASSGTTEVYIAQGSALDGRRTNLGRYSTPSEAHKAWQKYKIERGEYLKSLPENQNPLVLKGLSRIVNKIKSDLNKGLETITF